MNTKNMINKTPWNPSEDGPKVTVEFILPHHQEHLDDFLNASSIRSMLWELSNELRGCIKHGAPFDGMPMDESKIDFAEKIRQWINEEEASNKGINLE